MRRFIMAFEAGWIFYRVQGASEWRERDHCYDGEWCTRAATFSEAPRFIGMN